MAWRNKDGDESVKCYNCNETGHFARDCPQSGGSGQRRSRPSRTFSSVIRGTRACINCYQSGHISRDCPDKEPGERGSGYRFGRRGGRRGRSGRGGGGAFGGSSESACFNCDQVGHVLRDCPQRGPGRRGRRGREAVSFNYTRLGGRGRGGGESERKPTRIIFDDSD